MIIGSCLLARRRALSARDMLPFGLDIAAPRRYAGGMVGQQCAGQDLAGGAERGGKGMERVRR